MTIYEVRILTAIDAVPSRPFCTCKTLRKAQVQARRAYKTICQYLLETGQSTENVLVYILVKEVPSDSCDLFGDLPF